MATMWQSEVAKGKRTPPLALYHGDVLFQRFKFVFSSTFVAAGDVLELGVLPAYCRIIDYWVNPANLNGNATIGMMSGTFGVVDTARTVGAELYSAQALASTLIKTAPLAAAVNVANSGLPVSIGFTNSADIVGAANKSVELGLFFSAAL